MSDRENNELSPVQLLALPEIDGFPHHPFQVREDEEMQRLVESIREYGVLVPALVRPMGNRYQLISGHRRKAACEALGIERLPVIVREMSDREAVIAMADSNIQREHILPSEKAFAYSMKMEALRHQGRTLNDTSRQVVGRAETADVVAVNESGRQVQRYIRLTHLIPAILQQVDDGKIAFSPAVELSYLTSKEQQSLLEAMEQEDCTPSLSQAQRLKRLSAQERLTPAVMQVMLTEEKANQREQIKLPVDRLKQYFPKNYTARQMEQVIEKLLTDWQRRRTQRDRGDR